MINHINKYIFISLHFVALNILSQAKFTSKNAVGDWSGGTTDWTITGSDADNIPDENDTVEIKVGHLINTLSGSSTRICDFIINGTLATSSNPALYIYGNTELNGTITGTTSANDVS